MTKSGPEAVEDTRRGFHRLLVGSMAVVILVLLPLTWVSVRVALLGTLCRYSPAARQGLVLETLKSQGAAALPVLIELQLTASVDREEVESCSRELLLGDPAALPALLRILMDPVDEATRAHAIRLVELHLSALGSRGTVAAVSLAEARSTLAVGLARALKSARGLSRRRLLYLLRDLEVDGAPVCATLPKSLASRPILDLHDWPGRTVNEEWQLRVVRVSTILKRLTAMPDSPLVLEEALLEHPSNGLDVRRTLWPNVGLGQTLGAVIDPPRRGDLIHGLLPADAGGRPRSFFYALKPEGDRFLILGPEATAKLWLTWAH